MLTIDEIKVEGYEKVIEGKDPSIGLHCFIAVHNTSLGPALGGTRIYPYSGRQDALTDVLRLAKAMTYKSAIVEDGMGGGKSVIIANPAKDKTPQLLHAFAQVVDSLKGQYIAAEDVGSNTSDMVVIRQLTPYVCALPTDRSSGDPSRFTAWGVYRGIQAVSKQIWDTKCLRKKKILIQGLGSVGSKLANILFWEGADLLINDVDPKKIHDQALLYGAQIIETEKLFETPCDIFAPCALGGVINGKTVNTISCLAVAGAANNQLESFEDGIRLSERGILYAPDFIINAGGIINAAAEFEPQGYDPKNSRDKVNHIYDILDALFDESKRVLKPPCALANEIAEHNLKNRIGARQRPVVFKQ